MQEENQYFKKVSGMSCGDGTLCSMPAPINETGLNCAVPDPLIENLRRVRGRGPDIKRVVAAAIMSALRIRYTDRAKFEQMMDSYYEWLDAGCPQLEEWSHAPPTGTPKRVPEQQKGQAAGRPRGRKTG